MSLLRCQQPGCTVGETGICLLSVSPPHQCSNLRPTAGPEVPSTDLLPDPNAVAMSLSARAGPSPGRRFHSGAELGAGDATAISAAEYCHLIGVLGVYSAGKTCFLLSLYLMACRGQLPGFAFAGSLTLGGFEDRARHLRKWATGPLPEALADHTTLGDKREAGLLHLALAVGSGPEQRLSLLFTDLPGEWSTSLIDSAAVATRFAFLRRADGILLVVDGDSLATGARHVEIQRCKHILDRLRHTVGLEAGTRVTLAVSKGDKLEMRPPQDVGQLVTHSVQLGFDTSLVTTCAFSRSPGINSGAGVAEALTSVLSHTGTAASRRDTPPPNGARHFARFGRVL